MTEEKGPKPEGSTENRPEQSGDRVLTTSDILKFRTLLHDFRNNLSVVKSNVFCLRESDFSSDKERHEVCDDIDRAVELALAEADEMRDIVVGAPQKKSVEVEKVAESLGDEVISVLDDKEILKDTSIIHVDDQPGVLASVRRVLTGFGAKNVQGFEDPQQVLKLLDEAPEGTVFLVDHDMPDRMSGPELAQKILEKRPGAPIILISANELEELSELARDLIGKGMLSRIKKPFEPEELVRVILESGEPFDDEL